MRLIDNRTTLHGAGLRTRVVKTKRAYVLSPSSIQRHQRSHERVAHRRESDPELPGQQEVLRGLMQGVTRESGRGI